MKQRPNNHVFSPSDLVARFSHLTHSFLPLNILWELLYFSLRVWADYIFVGLVSHTPSLKGGYGALLHYPLSGVSTLRTLCLVVDWGAGMGKGLFTSC